MTEVKLGQIWIDNDKRRGHDRRLQVIEIDDEWWSSEQPYALCRNMATSKQTWIRVDRFRPTATGYRLEESTNAIT